MYTLYQIAGKEGKTTFLLSCPQRQDFCGIENRFRHEIPWNYKSFGSQFLLVNDSEPEEVWVVWGRHEVMNNEDVRSYNSMTPSTRSMFVAIHGGIEQLEKVNSRYANFHPGYKGFRFLSYESPSCTHPNCKICWPKVTNDQHRVRAIFDPNIYLPGKYPRHGKVHQKQIVLDGAPYMLEHVVHGFHVYDLISYTSGDFKKNSRSWRGSFRFEPVKGDKRFRVLEVATSNGQRTYPENLFVDSQKGAVRAILNQFFER